MLKIAMAESRDDTLFRKISGAISRSTTSGRGEWKTTHNYPELKTSDGKTVHSLAKWMYNRHVHDVETGKPVPFDYSATSIAELDRSSMDDIYLAQREHEGDSAPFGNEMRSHGHAVSPAIGTLPDDLQIDPRIYHRSPEGKIRLPHHHPDEVVVIQHPPTSLNEVERELVHRAVIIHELTHRQLQRAGRLGGRQYTNENENRATANSANYLRSCGLTYEEAARCLYAALNNHTFKCTCDGNHDDSRAKKLISETFRPEQVDEELLESLTPYLSVYLHYVDVVRLTDYEGKPQVLCPVHNTPMYIEDIKNQGAPFQHDVNRNYSEWGGRALTSEYKMEILFDSGTHLSAGSVLNPVTFSNSLTQLRLSPHANITVKVRGDYSEQDIQSVIGCYVPSLVALGSPKSVEALGKTDLSKLPSVGTIGLLPDPGVAGGYYLLHSFGEAGKNEAADWVALLSSITRSTL